MFFTCASSISARLYIDCKVTPPRGTPDYDVCGRRKTGFLRMMLTMKRPGEPRCVVASLRASERSFKLQAQPMAHERREWKRPGKDESKAPGSPET